MSQESSASTHAVPERPPHQPGVSVPSGGAGSLPPAQETTALNFAHLWAGAAVSLAAYLVLYAASLGLMLLALVGIAAGQGTLIPDVAGSLPTEETPDAWSQVGQLAAQLIAMAHMGALDTVVQGMVPFLGMMRGDAAAYAVPLVLLLMGALSVWLGSQLAERRVPSASWPQILLQSAGTGMVFSVLVNGVAAAASINFPAVASFSVDPISAANGWSAAMAFAIAAGVSLLSRQRVANRRALVAPAARLGRLNLPAAAVAVHCAVFAAVAVPAAWIAAAVSGGWSALLSGPLWIGNAVGYGLVAGHLGGLQVSWETSFVMGGQESQNEHHIVHGFGADIAGTAVAGASWGALALALVCAVITGITVLLRRGKVAAEDTFSWIPVPAAFLVLGLLLLPLLTAQGSFRFQGIAEGHYLLAPAWWSPAVFLVWGLLVEAIARFGAPFLLAFVPAWFQRLARAFTPATQPAPAAAGGDQHVPGGLSNSKPGTGVAKELSPAGKKRLLIWLAALGAVTVLAVGSLIAVNALKAGPDELVREYVQALVDGDAERAVTILDPSIPNEERVLLNNSVYGAAANRIDGFSVVSTKVSGETAIVQVELRQGGRKHEQAFSLYKDGPDFLDDKWKLGAVPLQRVAVSVDAQVAALSVNGSPVPTGQGAGNPSVTHFSAPAFPGAYAVELPEGDKYLAAAPQEVLLAIGPATEPVNAAQLRVTASEELRKETSRQVDAQLAACASSTELKPEACPFSWFAFGDVRNVKWSITAKPEYTLQRSYDGTWRLSGGSPGEASLTYERNASFRKADPDWETTTEKVDFYVRGSVSVDGEAVQVKLSRN